MPGERRPKILVCDDAKTIRALITALLSDNYEVLALATAEEALQRAVEFSPDLFISDLMMEGLNGYQLCEQVRQIPQLAHVPFILLTSKTDEESRATGLEAGADDYLFKPLKPRELMARVRSLIRLRFANLELDRRRQELEQANEKLSKLALQDGLTGLYNHRCFQERLLEEVGRAQRYRRPLTLVFFDLDHFKQLNDRHGHLMGDEVLRTMGKLLSGGLDATTGRRASDVVARYGGEELVMLLPETDRAGGVVKAQRICDAAARLEHSVAGVRVTVSAGVAELPLDANSAAELIQRADEALYQAKNRGRNCVVAQGDFSLEPNAAMAPLPSYRSAARDTAELIRRDRYLSTFFVDLADLARVEKEYGSQTFHAAIHDLVATIRKDTNGVFQPQDLINAGDPGRVGFVVFPNRKDQNLATTDIAELEAMSTRMAMLVETAAKETLRTLVVRPLRVAVGYAMSIDTRHFSHDRQVELLVRDAIQACHSARAKRNEREKIELQSLLLNNSLHSLYQPIVTADGRAISSYEALIRGPKGSRLASAYDLLEAAALAGLEWEFDRSCLSAAFAHGATLPPGTRLSVNVLPSTLYDQEFGLHWFGELIAGAGLTPDRIIVEVTEQSVISNLTRFRGALAPLRKAGIKIALDDVGVANANLEQVNAIVPDYLKLDRVLVDGAADSTPRRELIRSMVGLAKGIDAKVVGEGVERQVDWELLRDLGVDFVQGYYFARPGEPYPSISRKE